MEIGGRVGTIQATALLKMARIPKSVPKTTRIDYMYQEKREEEDLPASKTALTHPYNDSKTT